MQKPSKQLQAKWYKKLKESGFVDIEDVNSPLEMLKQWDSQYFQNICTPQQFMSRQEYFNQCRDFTHTHKFLSKKERLIWEAHSNGESDRQVAKTTKFGYGIVYQTVRRLKAFMQGIKHREVTPEDKAFVYSTWLRGAYYGSPFMAGINKKEFFKHYPAVIDKLLNRPGVEIKVACLRDDPTAILGYLVYEGTTLHWCFVRSGWREQGVAKALVGNIPFLTVTHSTKAGDAIRKKKEWDFNPWAI